VPNGINGVFVLSGDTAIGLPGSGNLISGNAACGVYLSGSGAKGRVQANTIGLNAGSTELLPNGASGVRLEGTTAVTVGGTDAGAGNTISGNLLHGVEILGATANGNTVQGNRIGTDADGSAALGNARAGVMVEQSSGNTIGGDIHEARNIIAGNGADGIAVNANGLTGHLPTTANVISGNYIGTDSTGSLDLGNAQNGVLLYDVTDCLVTGNVLSGNGGNGVKVLTFNDLAKDNSIIGNRIGTGADGSAALGNGGRGIDVDGARGTRIGGLTEVERNVISANGISGIVLHNIATGTLIQGNLIGTDPTGTIDLGNVNEGIFIENAPDSLVGGPEAGAGNLISGNDGVGVRILDEKATGNRVQGNRIGTASDGTAPLANGGHGVWVRQASGNTIGGETDGAGNTIRHNGADGVYVESGIDNAIRRNSIDGNAGLGIDLGEDGPTPNDTGDTDTGANSLQNSPVLAAVRSGGGTTDISGALDGAPETAYVVGFYSSPACDPSGFGEGETWLGEISVTTDAQGHAGIAASLPVLLPGGRPVTATTTSPAGDTSEFSACKPLAALLGDADGDADIDGADLVAVLRVAAGIDTIIVFENANVAPYPAADDRIDILDACRIARIVNGLE